MIRRGYLFRFPRRQITEVLVTLDHQRRAENRRRFFAIRAGAARRQVGEQFDGAIFAAYYNRTRRQLRNP
jgi:hypothetical protein